MTRRRLLIALAAIVVVIGSVLVVARRADDSDDQRATGAVAVSAATIAAGDGVTLSASVARPAGVRRPPLVVMPASWGQPATEYAAIARVLAGSGFVVVSYAQRGFAGSGGQVDLAGARTQADAGKVIDWALAQVDADPQRIGMYGISYGAGVSLLEAAKDPRVKAVAALSTWTDLGASFNPGGTSSTRALSVLISSLSGKQLSPEVLRLQALLKKRPTAVGAAVQALSPTRSPITYVPQLNRNQPAIMLANSFGDSLFPPEQLTTFFDALTTPKRLQLASGDHGTRDAAGLRDGRSGAVGDAGAWLAHYLRGVDNGISETPVVLTDAASGALRTAKSLTGGAQVRIALGPPNPSGPATTPAAAVWRAPILTGADTVATSGEMVAPFGRYRVPRAQLASLDRSRGLAWSHPVGDDPLSVDGIPKVSFDVTSSRANATIIAYLYDLDATGESRLMTMQPLTLRGLTPGRARATTFDLQPIAWTVPAGHAVVLVVDTVDPRYTGFNKAGTTITVSSVKARPATLTLPVVGS